MSSPTPPSSAPVAAAHPNSSPTSASAAAAAAAAAAAVAAAGFAASAPPAAAPDCAAATPSHHALTSAQQQAAGRSPDAPPAVASALSSESELWIAAASPLCSPTIAAPPPTAAGAAAAAAAAAVAPSSSTGGERARSWPASALRACDGPGPALAASLRAASLSQRPAATAAATAARDMRGGGGCGSGGGGGGGGDSAVASVSGGASSVAGGASVAAVAAGVTPVPLSSSPAAFLRLDSVRPFPAAPSTVSDGSDSADTLSDVDDASDAPLTQLALVKKRVAGLSIRLKHRWWLGTALLTPDMAPLPPAVGRLVSTLLCHDATIMKKIATHDEGSLLSSDSVRPVVRLLSACGVALEFARWLTVQEVQTSSEQTLFRRNNGVSKFTSAYVRLSAQKFLNSILAPQFSLVMSMTAAKLQAPKTVFEVLQRIVDQIIVALDSLPQATCQLLKMMEKEVSDRFPGRGLGIVKAFLFLRFLCPALVSPNNFGILPCDLDQPRKAIFTQVAKYLQYLANDTQSRLSTSFNKAGLEFMERNSLPMATALENLLRSDHERPVFDFISEHTPCAFWQCSQCSALVMEAESSATCSSCNWTNPAADPTKWTRAMRLEKDAARLCVKLHNNIDMLLEALGQDSWTAETCAFSKEEILLAASAELNQKWTGEKARIAFNRFEEAVLGDQLAILGEIVRGAPLEYLPDVAHASIAITVYRGCGLLHIHEDLLAELGRARTIEAVALSSVMHLLRAYSKLTFGHYMRLSLLTALTPLRSADGEVQAFDLESMDPAQHEQLAATMERMAGVFLDPESYPSSTVFCCQLLHTCANSASGGQHGRWLVQKYFTDCLLVSVLKPTAFGVAWETDTSLGNFMHDILSRCVTGELFTASPHDRWNDFVVQTHRAFNECIDALLQISCSMANVAKVELDIIMRAHCWSEVREKCLHTIRTFMLHDIRNGALQLEGCSDSVETHTYHLADRLVTVLGWVPHDQQHQPHTRAETPSASYPSSTAMSPRSSHPSSVVGEEMLLLSIPPASSRDSTADDRLSLFGLPSSGASSLAGSSFPPSPQLSPAVSMSSLASFGAHIRRAVSLNAGPGSSGSVAGATMRPVPTTSSSVSAINRAQSLLSSSSTTSSARRGGSAAAVAAAAAAATAAAVGPGAGGNAGAVAAAAAAVGRSMRSSALSDSGESCNVSNTSSRSRLVPYDLADLGSPDGSRGQSGPASATAASAAASAAVFEWDASPGSAGGGGGGGGGSGSGSGSAKGHLHPLQTVSTSTLCSEGGGAVSTAGLLPAVFAWDEKALARVQSDADCETPSAVSAVAAAHASSVLAHAQGHQLSSSSPLSQHSNTATVSAFSPVMVAGAASPVAAPHPLSHAAGYAAVAAAAERGGSAVLLAGSATRGFTIISSEDNEDSDGGPTAAKASSHGHSIVSNSNSSSKSNSSSQLPESSSTGLLPTMLSSHDGDGGRTPVVLSADRFAGANTPSLSDEAVAAAAANVAANATADATANTGSGGSSSSYSHVSMV